MTRKVLGRGLDALIPQSSVTPPSREPVDEVHRVRVDQVVPNPWQPRSTFESTRLEELAQSIREKGILEPLLLRPMGDDSYQVIAGERRLRAAELAGLTEVPALFREYHGRESLEIALIENLQREDLNPVEEARAYQRLVEEFHRTHAEISQEVGKDRSTITNLLRLLRLGSDILDLVSRGTLSVGHARVLLAVEDEEERRTLAQLMVDEGWSVRQAERHVGGVKKPARRSAPTTPATRDREVVRVEEALRYTLGTEVHLHHSAAGGKIEIAYADSQELERILDLLGVQIH